MYLFTQDFVIHELHVLLSDDIYTLLNSSKMYQKLHKERLLLRYWNFNEKYSHKYCTENEPSWLSYLPSGNKVLVTFNEYINLRINTQKRLSLKLMNNFEINDTHTHHLAKAHALNLTRCLITDEGVKHLGNVHTLNLSYCRYITDEGIKYLGNIHTLNISKCCVTYAVRHLGNVHTLNLSHCYNIVDEDIRHLAKVHTLYLSHFCGLSHKKMGKACLGVPLLQIFIYYTMLIHTKILCIMLRTI